MPQQIELVKVIVQSVVAVREGDRIINEIESPLKPCYSPEELVAYWELCKQEVIESNEKLMATEPNGNRAARRSKGKSKA